MARDMNYFIDGVAMNDPQDRWWCVDDSTVMSGLQRNSVDPQVQGMDGVNPFYSETLGPTSVGLNMVARRTGTRTEQETYQAVASIMAKNGSAIMLQRQFRSQTVQAPAKLNGITNVVRDPTAMDIYFTAVFTIPSVFYRDVNFSTWAQVPVSGTQYQVTTLNDSRFPIKDALIRLTGPCSSGSLVDVNGYAAISTPTLAAGQTCVIDTASGRATQFTGTGGFDFSGTGQVDRTSLVNPSGPSAGYQIFSLTPQAYLGDPFDMRTYVTWTVGGLTSSSKIEIYAKRAFL
jgi:hypothetical protein